MQNTQNLAFGPVPSRRLGRSLGINNIPPKTCSYSCIYCQLGRTNKLSINRQAFYKPEDILKEVKRRVHKVISRKEKINYLTLVPDGEPTLDINLGKTISALKKIGIKIAVLTNSSLIWREDVRQDLMEANLVSLKVDVVRENLWKKINRPHKSLKLNDILQGVIEFAKEFKGTVITETMLIRDINYGNEFEEIAKFLKNIRGLSKSYIAIPTRPPAEKWVKPASERTLNRAFQVFTETLGENKVEYLIGYEGNAFTLTGNVKEDLLSITAVHPMRKEAVMKFLEKAEAEWDVIEKLLKEKKLVKIEYDGKEYYMRKLTSLG